MEVYALIGKSGTGKSYYAPTLARLLNIDWLIDDGLIIHQGIIQGGYSSKFEKTKMAAVRRAIFHDETHREGIIKILQNQTIEKILLLGTSDHMVEIIQERLGLPKFEEKFYIEKLVDDAYLERAQNHREQGRHTIPVQAVELIKNRTFSQQLRKRIQKLLAFKQEEESLVTVMYPEYNQGRVWIEKNAVEDLVRIEMENFPGLLPLTIHTQEEYTVFIEISVTLQPQLYTVVQELQKKIRDSFVSHLNAISPKVHITIKRIQ